LVPFDAGTHAPYFVVVRHEPEAGCVLVTMHLTSHRQEFVSKCGVHGCSLPPPSRRPRAAALTNRPSVSSATTGYQNDRPEAMERAYAGPDNANAISG
jgi:hypothetical protein